MKNLKLVFEREDGNNWKNSMDWEPRGKKGRKYRKGKDPKRMIEERRKERVRSTWE